MMSRRAASSRANATMAGLGDQGSVEIEHGEADDRGAQLCVSLVPGLACRGHTVTVPSAGVGLGDGVARLVRGLACQCKRDPVVRLDGYRVLDG
jgi:hypothetical protein